MRASLLALVILAAPVGAGAALLPAGTYTNEEEVYFDKEAKRPPAPWIGLSIDAAGTIAFVDVFSRPAESVAYKTLAPAGIIGRLRMTLSDGRITELRRARTATCWGAAPKAVKKADGSEDWYGASALKLHDQGGRVTFGGGATGAPEVILRMRNVIWPSGANRPSLVLYVHKPDDFDHAVTILGRTPMRNGSASICAGCRPAAPSTA